MGSPAAWPSLRDRSAAGGAGRTLGFLLVVALAGAVGCKPRIARISVSPTRLSLGIGQAGELRVEAGDEHGGRVEPTLEAPLGLDVRWTSSASEVVAVEAVAQERSWRPQARVVALAPGRAVVTARSGDGMQAQAEIIVERAQR